MNRIAHIALALALVAGCGSKKDDKSSPPPAGSSTAGSGSATAPPPAGSGSAAAGSAAAGSAAAGSAAAAVDVPTEMDFEDEAKSNITAKNVENELKSIEQELGNK